MRRKRIKTFSSPKTGLIFLLIGILCFTIFFSLKVYRQFEKKVTPFSEKPNMVTSQTADQYPARIIIPSLGINLPVFEAKAIEEKWEFSNIGASYLLGSGVPGESGNTVIYGHNLKRIFGPILWIKKGVEITIINKRNENFTFVVTETKTISPEQISVLMPSRDKKLTLYTCTGFMDSKRFIVSAKLKL